MLKKYIKKQSTNSKFSTAAIDINDDNYIVEKYGCWTYFFKYNPFILMSKKKFNKKILKLNQRKSNNRQILSASASNIVDDGYYDNDYYDESSDDDCIVYMTKSEIEKIYREYTYRDYNDDEMITLYNRLDKIMQV